MSEPRVVTRPLRAVREVLVCGCGTEMENTGLALLGIGTYHSKYISFTMPALAVASGCEIARRFASSTPTQRMLIAIGFAYTAVFLAFVTFNYPELAEIDPRFVFPVFEHLPW